MNAQLDAAQQPNTIVIEEESATPVEEAAKRKSSPVPTTDDGTATSGTAKKLAVSAPEKVSSKTIKFHTHNQARTTATHATRLHISELVMPYFLYCKWTRGVPRRRTKSRPTKTNGETPTNRVRKATELDRKGRISSRWRVSRAHILSQNAKRSRICSAIKQKCNKYIGSKRQQERIRYCTKMYDYFSHINRHRTESETELTELWDSIPQTSWLCQSSQNPVRTRGKRPGRPAGPGLPHGDLTGDDD